MMKRLIVPAILLSISTIATAQVFTIDPVPGAPFTFRAQEPGLTLPPPSAPVEPFISRVGWLHFTMFSAGQFSGEAIISKTFNSTGTKSVFKDRKGKYTPQTSPPHAARTVTISTTTVQPPANPSVSPVFRLRQFQVDSIHPEWGSAALSDTHYFAIVLKNTDPEIAQRGSLSLRFPTNSFDYIGTVFPPNTSVFGAETHYRDNGDNSHRPGTVYTWPVNNIPQRDSQTIFVQLRVKDRVQDSLQLIQLNSDLRFVNSQSDNNSNTGTTILFVKTDTEPRVENPYNFRQTNSTVVAINAARDPNGISVFPEILPPSRNAPAHHLVYTVHVEDMGQVMAKFLIIDITFDPKIATGSPILPTALNFPNADFTNPDEAKRFSSGVIGWNGSTLRLVFNNANLAPAGGGVFSRATFNLEIDTKSGIELKDGEQLATSAVINMKSSATATDDIVNTDPAFVHIEQPGKVPFGCVFGIKGHTSLLSPDSSTWVRGLDITARFPIINRRIDDLSAGSFVPPHLFWQLEAGWGTSSFKNPADGGLFETRYIHFSPVTIRYYQPFHAGSYYMYSGFSAGYSAGYIYSGKSNGQTAALPSGFGKRLEHEVALSVDFSNRIDVPAWTFGAGYKWRWNKLLDQNASYGLPFIYLQLDIVRINKRLVRIWDKTRYCH